MSIYTYTLKKYLKSKSTWVITFLGIVVSGLLGGVLPWSLYEPASDITGKIYSALIIGQVGGVTILVSTFTSIFAGFKSSSMYKDEVEDGTFLVMLSKPQTRTRIILFKWLSLNTIIAIFISIVVFAFGFFNIILDKHDPVITPDVKSLRSNIMLVMTIMWLIFFVVSLIFSSLGLLISTRTSTGATLGISIALGVIIPITGLFQSFTKLDANNLSKNVVIDSMHNLYDSTYNEYKNAQYSSNSEFTDAGISLSNLYDVINDKDYGLAKIGVITGDTDTYGFWSTFDIQYQIGQLANYVTESMITEKDREILLSSVGNLGFTQSVTKKVISDNNTFGKLAKDKNKTTEAQEYLNKMVLNALSAGNDFGIKYKKALEIQNDLFIKAGESSNNTNNFYDLSTEPDQVYDDISVTIEIGEISRTYNLLKMKSQWQSNMEFAESFIGLADKDDNDILKLDSALSTMIEKDIIANTATQYDVVVDRDAWKNNDIEIKDENGDVKFIIKKNSYDARLYSELVSMVEDDKELLNMIDEVEYKNKNSILIVYILLGLLLIPLSIWTVKRQDFK